MISIDHNGIKLQIYYENKKSFLFKIKHANKFVYNIDDVHKYKIAHFVLFALQIIGSISR